MQDFYKIYMQKEREGSELKETIKDFGLYCMDSPFILYTTARKLTEREWPGEDGKDVYVPSRLDVDAYSIKLKFGYKGAEREANNKIKAFLEYLTGRDGSGVYMKMYCDYTNIGRRHVRFSQIPGDPVFFRDGDGDFLVFDLEMNVDDPVTDIVPSADAGGNIINLV